MGYQKHETDDSEMNPATSFQSQAAEGDIMAKQGDCRKAIEAYTKVLS
jgi:predicted negative regulator of RcsB-dependent stress response